MKVRLHLMVTQFCCSSWEKRAASLHSSTSTRLQCLRNAECVCKNTAFVHASSTVIFIRIPPDPLPAQVCATIDLIIDFASSISTAQNTELGRKQADIRLHLTGLIHLCDYWINCSSGKSTTVAYRWFNHSSGRVEAHL